MQKFNQYFQQNVIRPLLGKIFTDMGAENTKPYLAKLAQGTGFYPNDRAYFIHDYFLVDNLYKKFFKDSKSYEDFQNKFLDQFVASLKKRIDLSGSQGITKYYAADKDGKFSPIKQNNIYRLGGALTLNFEKDRIANLIQQKQKDGEITEEKAKNDSNLCQRNELHLIEIDGTEMYISTDEAKEEAATDPAFQEVVEDGKQAKVLELELKVEKQGFTIAEPLHLNEKGIAEGKVQDDSGEIFALNIDTTKPPEEQESALQQQLHRDKQDQALGVSSPASTETTEPTPTTAKKQPEAKTTTAKQAEQATFSMGNVGNIPPVETEVHLTQGLNQGEIAGQPFHSSLSGRSLSRLSTSQQQTLEQQRTVDLGRTLGRQNLTPVAHLKAARAARDQSPQPKTPNVPPRSQANPQSQPGSRKTTGGSNKKSRAGWIIGAATGGAVATGFGAMITGAIFTPDDADVALKIVKCIAHCLA